MHAPKDAVSKRTFILLNAENHILVLGLYVWAVAVYFAVSVGVNVSRAVGYCLLNWHWPAEPEGLNDSAWFACLVPLLFVWASKGSLRVTVFSLSLVPLPPCWAKGILLQSCHDNYWALLDIETWCSDSRKWGYFLTLREQLPALRCVDVCQGQGTPIRVQSLSVVP